ncbi:unnamed protein product [Prorocentrum cordatum]|uniref:Uncharacterized protein n=1 Tax=Prorocentrum cordatum TaxID=2364126 RepID=A0ABN9SXY8_9DINO|nr:unnamed protein product [Polarella glacialis]
MASAAAAASSAVERGGALPVRKRPVAAAAAGASGLGLASSSAAATPAADRHVARRIQAPPAAGGNAVLGWPPPPPGAEPWQVRGHQLMMWRVDGETGEFLYGTTCFMCARTPKMCWRGLRDECAGVAASRARKGSRAQARNDLVRGLLPGSEPKKAFGAFVAPTAEPLGGETGAGGGRRPGRERCREHPRGAGWRGRAASQAPEDAHGGRRRGLGRQRCRRRPHPASGRGGGCGLRLRLGRGGARPRGGGSHGESGRSGGRACAAQYCI